MKTGYPVDSRQSAVSSVEDRVEGEGWTGREGATICVPCSQCNGRLAL